MPDKPKGGNGTPPRKPKDFNREVKRELDRYAGLRNEVEAVVEFYRRKRPAQ